MVDDGSEAIEPILRDAGERVDYDTELHLHNEVLRSAYGIRHHDGVLDIGCGTGETTRDAARMASAGTVLGVDTSAAAIEQARARTHADGLRNVSYEVADVQAYAFPPAQYDVAISRFGTMFFTDPVAAFSNIVRALRPGGRLVMMVWQDHDRNEWAVSIDDALTADGASRSLPDDAMDPFSMGDPATVKAILSAAGFADVGFSDVHAPVFYGRDVTTALEWVRGFSVAKQTLQQLEPASRARALHRLADALAAHAREDGVWLESRAWIVSAHR